MTLDQADTSPITPLSTMIRPLSSKMTCKPSPSCLGQIEAQTGYVWCLSNPFQYDWLRIHSDSLLNLVLIVRVDSWRFYASCMLTWLLSRVKIFGQRRSGNSVPVMIWLEVSGAVGLPGVIPSCDQCLSLWAYFLPLSVSPLRRFPCWQHHWWHGVGT